MDSLVGVGVDVIVTPAAVAIARRLHCKQDSNCEPVVRSMRMSSTSSLIGTKACFASPLV